MCLPLLENRTQKASVDISVFKVVLIKDDKLVSPLFNNFEWELGKERFVKIKFAEYKDKFKKQDSDSDKFKYVTEDGLYSSDDAESYLKGYSFFIKGSLEIYEAIIPKGSEYVKYGNEYCSNKLMLIKKCV